MSLFCIISLNAMDQKSYSYKASSELTRLMEEFDSKSPEEQAELLKNRQSIDLDALLASCEHAVNSTPPDEKLPDSSSADLTPSSPSTSQEFTKLQESLTSASVAPAASSLAESTLSSPDKMAPMPSSPETVADASHKNDEPTNTSSSTPPSTNPPLSQKLPPYSLQTFLTMVHTHRLLLSSTVGIGAITLIVLYGISQRSSRIQRKINNIESEAQMINTPPSENTPITQ